MKYFLIAVLLFATNAIAKDTGNNPPLGTYSAFTEQDWTVAFELKEKGKAVIITNPQTKSSIGGTWKFNAPVLTISYQNYQDRFVLANDCYQGRTCFRYDKRLSRNKMKSPLSVDYEFVNWDEPAKAQTLGGFYVYGHEVETFKPCGSRQALWITGEKSLLKVLRDNHAAITKQAKPYAEIYVRLVGFQSEQKGKEGFAGDYPEQFLVEQILEIWPKTENSCVVK